MSTAPKQPGKRTLTRTHLWVGSLTLLLLAALVAGVAWWRLVPETRVWTDGGDLVIPAENLPIRRVIWTEPEPIGEAFNTDQQEYELCIAPNGLERIFVRGLPGQGANLMISRKVHGEWTTPEPLEDVNSEHDELGPRLSRDGRVLLFYSNRPGGEGGYDLWASSRTAYGFSPPKNLGPDVNSPHDEASPAMDGPGERLFFASNRIARETLGPAARWNATVREPKSAHYDLFVAAVSPAKLDTETTKKDELAPPLPFSVTQAHPLQNVNTPSHEGTPCVSPAGDFLYFTSDRPGGLGGFDLYRTRLTPAASPVENMGAPVNSPANEIDPQIAQGGFGLYFSCDRPHSYEQVPSKNDDGTIATNPAGNYDLFLTESREVFPRETYRDWPALGWAFWSTLIALALLIPILLYLRATDYRHLSILQKCAAISILVHLLLMFLFSAFTLARDIQEYIAPEKGLELAVNLDLADEVIVTSSLREQITKLALREPTLTTQEQIETAPPQPAPTPVEAVKPPLPPTKIVPVARELLAPQQPDTIPPRITTELHLPTPQIKAPTPTLTLTPPPTTTAKEATPTHKPAEPKVAIKPIPAAIEPNAKPRETKFTPAPATILPESLVQAAAPLLPQTPRDATPAPPAPAEIELATLQTAQPNLAHTPVRETPPPQAIIVEEKLPTAKTETAAPNAENARTVTQAVPTAETRDDSLATSLPTPDETAESLTPDSRVAIALPVTDAVAVTPPSQTAPAAVAQEADLPDAVAQEQALHTTRRDTETPTQQAPLLAATSDDTPKRPDAHLDATPLDTETPAMPELALLAPQAHFAVTALPGEIGPPKLAAPPSFEQRSKEQRKRLVEELGGSEKTESAVALALGYLARSQNDDGSWTKSPLRGKPKRDSKTKPHKMGPALTGLSSLCFLAANHTPTAAGPYQAVIRKAMDRLVAVQLKSGSWQEGGGRMYGHAIATLAMAEAAAMTGEKKYRAAAILGAKFIKESQNKNDGGWRYEPNQAGDTSVLGWCVMALHSVEGLGIQIPKETRRGAMRWLDSVSGGKTKILAGYQNTNATPIMSAEAAFSRILLNQPLSPDQQKELGDYLLKSNLTKQKQHSFYGWYYASLALMQIGGEAWDTWNPGIRDYLVKLQKKSGRERGAWTEKPKHGHDQGGAIYTTAMATLTLEVYYRYLPIYKHQRTGNAPKK